MKIKLIRAHLKDAEELWKMQVESFSELLDRYQDFDTSPANEPIEKVQQRLSQSFTYFYFICMDEQKIGAVRVVDKKEEGKCKRISPISILPQYRGKGYAQRAIQLCEEIHGAQAWELGTILQEKGNCHLYEKMGYRKTGKTKKINEKMTLVFYEK